MFSQIIKKCSSVAVFRSMFIALLIGTISSSYACSDSEYKNMIRKPLDQIFESTDDNGSFTVYGVVKYNVVVRAKEISNISNRCAQNAQSYESKQKILRMEMYADSFIRNTHGYVDSVKGATNNFVDMQDSNSSKGVWGNLFEGIINQSLYQAHEQGMVEDYNEMVTIFKSF